MKIQIQTTTTDLDKVKKIKNLAERLDRPAEESELNAAGALLSLRRKVAEVESYE